MSNKGFPKPNAQVDLTKWMGWVACQYPRASALKMEIGFEFLGPYPYKKSGIPANTKFFYIFSPLFNFKC